MPTPPHPANPPATLQRHSRILRVVVLASSPSGIYNPRILLRIPRSTSLPFLVSVCKGNKFYRHPEIVNQKISGDKASLFAIVPSESCKNQQAGQNDVDDVPRQAVQRNFEERSTSPRQRMLFLVYVRRYSCICGLYYCVSQFTFDTPITIIYLYKPRFGTFLNNVNTTRSYVFRRIQK